MLVALGRRGRGRPAARCGSPEPDVRLRPYCESRRDRAAHPAGLPDARPAHDRGPLTGRPRRTACPRTQMSPSASARLGRAQLSRRPRSFSRPRRPAPRRSIPATDSCRRTRISPSVSLRPDSTSSARARPASARWATRSPPSAPCARRACPACPARTARSRTTPTRCARIAAEIGYPVILRRRAAAAAAACASCTRRRACSTPSR